jgi:hypothetical protein
MSGKKLILGNLDIGQQEHQWKVEGAVAGCVPDQLQRWRVLPPQVLQDSLVLPRMGANMVTT